MLLREKADALLQPSLQASYILSMFLNHSQDPRRAIPFFPFVCHRLRPENYPAFISLGSSNLRNQIRTVLTCSSNLDSNSSLSFGRGEKTA